MTEKVTISATQGTTNNPVNSFDINQYIGWFEKINLNTVVWQVIALIIILYFGKEIKALIKAILDKIPQLKSAGSFEFEFSNETKAAVKQSSNRLQEEIKAYEIVAERDPNVVFLTIFIDIEKKLTEICTDYYVNDDLAWLRASTTERFQSLVRNKILDPQAFSIYQDVKMLRNKIAHGEKPLANISEAQPYFEALILLKDLVSKGLEKVLSKGKQQKTGNA